MPSVYFFLLCSLGNARYPQSLCFERSLLCFSAYYLASKWLVSTNGPDPLDQYLHAVSSVQRGRLSGAPDCNRPQLCVGSEPTDPAPPLELQNAPPSNPNSQPPASAYTVRGQGTTWVSLGLSGKQCGPDINSLTAAIALYTPFCLPPCWTCGPLGQPSWPLPTPCFLTGPLQMSASLPFLSSLFKQSFGGGEGSRCPWAREREGSLLGKAR